MAAVQAEIDTDSGPPSDVPLLHFVVAIVFLLAGVVFGLLAAVGYGFGFRLAHVHASLAGWVCITIMGATTQFVPVWNDRELYSRKLAMLQLLFVATGVAGMSIAASSRNTSLFYIPGVLATLGFWVFSYNVTRTLHSDDGLYLDVTELHFQVAVVYAVLATAVGLTLAFDLEYSFLSTVSWFDRASLVYAHVSFAVYGFVLTTIAGAIYQLTTMFTQTELTTFDRSLRRLETAVYPVSPALVAVAYILDAPGLLAIGTAGVVVGLLCLCVVVGRKLWVSEMDVVGHPMLVRYAVAVSMLALWTTWRGWRTVFAGFSRDVVGGSSESHLLLAGFVSVVVVGTLYHVVPFLIWIHRYSDLLGYEKVPLVDDLYSSRVERTELALTVTAVPLLVAVLHLEIESGAVVAGVVLAAVYLLFAFNILYTVKNHQPGGLLGALRVLR